MIAKGWTVRIASFAICLLFAGSAATAQTLAWIQLGPDGRILARAVTDEASCPDIVIDGKSLRMSARTQDIASTTRRLICEQDVGGARAVAVAGNALRLPTGAPRRIAILGDTGCRIKVGGDPDDDEVAATAKVQDCNDSSSWPFRAVAAAIRRAAPDLIIHVGDYLYRESPCPAKDGSQCGGSPWGDNWPTWQADFFAPAANLLPAAPWVFIRGNHESCSRSGAGWTRYLDPRPMPGDGKCVDNTAPYAIKLGTFQAFVLDSSIVPDKGPSQAEVDRVVAQFKTGASLGLKDAWLLSHRPIWAAKAGKKGDRATFQTLNETLQSAWKTAPIDGIELIVAGHTHLFELFDFEDRDPPQMVVGIGGTDLARKIRSDLEESEIGGSTVRKAATAAEFGFVMMERAANDAGWVLALYDSDGDKRLTCSIVKRRTTCKK